MSTPTDAEVREAYQMSEDGIDFKGAFFQRGRDWDAWLAEHDAKLLNDLARRADADLTVDVYEGVAGIEFFALDPISKQRLHVETIPSIGDWIRKTATEEKS